MSLQIKTVCAVARRKLNATERTQQHKTAVVEVEFKSFTDTTMLNCIRSIIS